MKHKTPTPCGFSGPVSPTTTNKEKFQETVAVETTAHGAQGIPSLCAVRPSCRRLHGVYRCRSHAAFGAEARRLGAACRQCGTVALSIERFASSMAGRSAVAGATLGFALGTPFRTREPGQQNEAASGTAAGQHLPQKSQPLPVGEPLENSPPRRRRN